MLPEAEIFENRCIGWENSPPGEPIAAEADPFLDCSINFNMQAGERNFEMDSAGFKTKMPAVEENLSGENFIPETGIEGACLEH